MHKRERFRFRAWDRKNERMLYNIQYAFDGKEEAGLVEGDGSAAEYFESSFGEFLESSIYTVMAYTTLDDREGTPIYEGDTIRYESETGEEGVGEVVFEHGRFTVESDGKSVLLIDVVLAEVTGNIFEGMGARAPV